jgi:hypothetical protein
MSLMTTRASSGAGPLADIRLTQSERREAEQYLELGERIAGLIIRVASAVSSALHEAVRGLRALTESRSTH